MKDFRSDNTHGASPEILEAIARANAGTMTSYGGDEITERVRRKCSEIFGREVDVYPVITGTAANALSIAAVTPPGGGIVCHEDSHIKLEELGAAEFFSGGKFVALPGADGKLHPDAIVNGA